jgi:hypothetical protein
MTKVVINACHGGFGLSHEAILAYLDKCGLPVWTEANEKFGSIIPFTYYLVPPEEQIKGDPDNWHDMTLAERQAHNAAYSSTVFYARDLARDDPDLVAVVEELGNRANGLHAELKVVEIPDDVNWYVQEYDGCEWVAERHRTWE